MQKKKQYLNWIVNNKKGNNSNLRKLDFDSEEDDYSYSEEDDYFNSEEDDYFDSEEDDQGNVQRMKKINIRRIILLIEHLARNSVYSSITNWIVSQIIQKIQNEKIVCEPKSANNKVENNANYYQRNMILIAFLLLLHIFKEHFVDTFISLVAHIVIYCITKYFNIFDTNNKYIRKVPKGEFNETPNYRTTQQQSNETKKRISYSNKMSNNNNGTDDDDDDQNDDNKTPNKNEFSRNEERVEINTRIITFNIYSIYDDSEEEYKSTKIMIYKTYNNKGYYIDEINDIGENEKLEITLRTTPESFETIKEALITSGITITSEAEASYTLTRDERIAYFNNFNERRTLLNMQEAKNIKCYTWTDGNIQSEIATIEGWENRNMMKLSLPITNTPDNEGKYYQIIRNMMQITTSVNYTLVEDTTDVSQLSLTVNEENTSELMTILITNNIAFKLEEKYEITNDNLEGEIWHRLNNKSIAMTFKASTMAYSTNDMFIKFNIALQTEHEEEETKIKDFLYYHSHEANAYFEITQYETNTKTYTINGVISRNELETLTRYMTEQEISISIIGASYMQEEEEITSLNTLRQERKQYARSIVNTTTMKCIIDKAYCNEDENYTATKTMIYKTIKVHGYYIENIEENNNQLELTIRTTKEQSETIYQTFTEFGIAMYEVEESVLEATNKEKSELFERFKERVALLKNENAKIIKTFTWTEANKLAELAKINSIEEREIQILSINTESITTTLPNNEEKYYSLLRSIRKLPLNVEFTIIEDMENNTSIKIHIEKTKYNEFRDSLLANNISFNVEDEFTLTEENVYNEIWHRLNNMSIDITYKENNNISIKQQTLYIHFLIENVTIEQEDINEIRRIIYLNAKDASIYVHEIRKIEGGSKYNITGYAKQDQFSIFTSYMTSCNVTTTIIGATKMLTSEEKAMVTTLKKQRKQLYVTKINITTIKFSIEKIYKRNIEASKAMIYKTFNIDNYYISDITPIDETNSYDITIYIRAEKADVITQAFTDAGIEIKETKQEEVYLRKEEIAEFEKNMQERVDILKNKEYKLTKIYTWTEGKKEALRKL